MTMRMGSLTDNPAWQALKAHYAKVRDVHLRPLFADDPQRGEHMTAEACGIYFDYSKNRITKETLKLLLELAEAVGLRDRVDAMFRGEKINLSERRAPLHVALRRSQNSPSIPPRRSRSGIGSAAATRFIPLSGYQR
jgi:glucose-6-phosphate isomerase